jgi:hypothetical protein
MTPRRTPVPLPPAAPAPRISSPLAHLLLAVAFLVGPARSDDAKLETVDLVSRSAIDLAAAGLDFVAPPGFENVTLRPPLLLEAAKLERSREIARLRIAVLPIGPLEPAAERPATAIELFDRVGRGSPATWLKEAESVTSEGGVEMTRVILDDRAAARRILIRAIGARVIAAELRAAADRADALEFEVRTAFAALANSHASLPATPATTVRAEGVELLLPAPFVRDRRASAAGDPLELLRGATPPHLGLPARIALRWLDHDLGLPLATALAAERSRVAAAGGTIHDFGADAASGRLGYSRDDHVVDLVWLEAGRRRLELALACRVADVEHFAAARAALASAVALAPSDPPSEPVRLANGPEGGAEVGIELRPPARFAAVKGGTPLLEWIERGAKDPARLAVNLVSEGRRAPRDDAEALLFGRVRESEVLRTAADRGLERFEPPSPARIGSRPAATFALRGERAGRQIVDRRYVVFDGERGIEIAFEVPAERDAGYAALRDAVLASVRARAWTVPFELLSPVAGEHGAFALAPPLDWRRLETADGTLAFVPAAGPEGARVTAGRIAIASKRGGLGDAERIRRALEERIEAEGGEWIRYELESRSEGAPFRFRVTYTANGTPMRELCSAVLEGDEVAFARGQAPAERFVALEPLLDAVIASARLR